MRADDRCHVGIELALTLGQPGDAALWFAIGNSGF